jgi:hypothetical protein
MGGLPSKILKINANDCSSYVQEQEEDEVREHKAPPSNLTSRIGDVTDDNVQSWKTAKSSGCVLPEKGTLGLYAKEPPDNNIKLEGSDREDAEEDVVTGEREPENGVKSFPTTRRHRRRRQRRASCKDLKTVFGDPADGEFGILMSSNRPPPSEGDAASKKAAFDETLDPIMKPD